MTSRKTTNRIAKLMLGVMLFVQAAIALAVCESPERSPALAVSVQQADGKKCHEEESANANINLCLAHCLAADQSLDKPNVSVPPLAAAPVLALPSLHRFLPDAVAPRRIVVPPAATPPPRIVFRTLLI